MSNRDEWATLLARLDNRLVHYSPEYVDFLVRALPGVEVRVLEWRDGATLDGVLLAAIRTHSQYGTVVNSLPFFGSHGGPLASTAKACHALLSGFRSLVADVGAVSATLIEDPLHPLDDTSIEASGLEVVDDRIGQFTELPAHMGSFHVKTRNAIRKGQRLDLSVARRDDAASWSWMQRVHEQSITALGGVPKSQAVFSALRETMGAQVELWVGTVRDEPVSGVVVIRYRGTVEYFTPVVEESHRESQALSATIFAVMQRMAETGSTLWNWGGTWRTQEGVYRFKSRWGARDLPYRYLNRVSDPALRLVSRDALAAAFPNFYLFRY